MSHRIAIFASGGGSNALKIIEYFQDHASIEVGLIVTNNEAAGVLAHAKYHQIPSRVVDKKAFQDQQFGHELHQDGITFIVLAGFLWLIPAYLVQQFPQSMVNIHPALLPSYGGKGMYGMHVHRAVKDAHESESGITIHYVNEKYDEGQIIYQASCTIDPTDAPEDIQRKVQELEHRHYARIVEQVVQKKQG